MRTVRNQTSFYVDSMQILPQATNTEISLTKNRVLRIKKSCPDESIKCREHARKFAEKN